MGRGDRRSSRKMRNRKSASAKKVRDANKAQGKPTHPKTTVDD